MVEALDPRDLPAAIELLGRVGLTGALASVARYLRWQPDGAWCVRVDGALAGMVTLLRFGQVGFVGCMAVDPAHQGRGLGRRLLEHAHAAGRRAGVTTFLLEATASGQPLYTRLGYVVEHETWNVARPTTDAAAVAASEVRAIEPADRDALVALDRRATGSPRDVMIQGLVADHPGAVERATGQAAGGAALAAYGLFVAGRIGPVIASDPGAGRAVIDRLAGAVPPGAPAFASVPVANEPAMAAFAAHGFAFGRSLHRMRLGPPIATPAHWVWSLASPGAG